MRSQTLAQRDLLQLIVQKPNGIAYQADQGKQVTGLVAAIILGVVAVPGVAITCARR